MLSIFKENSKIEYPWIKILIVYILQIKLLILKMITTKLNKHIPNSDPTQASYHFLHSVLTTTTHSYSQFMDEENQPEEK